jgi:DNA-binding transcriptional LysR family regulator
VVTKRPNWDGRIGRRVRLRDLHILFAVVQYGSMAKAGPHLGMSQSAVSQAIAALEHALGVPLLDRTPRGVELTMYGAALTRRGQAAFDELRSGVKDIEFLMNPEVGEIRIACTEAIAGGVLPAAIERFSLRHPKVKVHVIHTSTHLGDYAALHERTADLVLALRPFEAELPEHLQAEVLFYDRICLAVAKQSTWARRRKIDFASLVDAAFISPSTDSPGGVAVIEAFRTAGLPMPQVTVSTFSVHLRNILSMRGHFIAVLPASIMRFNPGLYSLKELPLDLPIPQLPASIVTLKNRTLSPVVERFIECARDIAKVMRSSSEKSKAIRTAVIKTSALGA